MNEPPKLPVDSCKTDLPVLLRSCAKVRYERKNANDFFRPEENDQYYLRSCMLFYFAVFD